MARLWMMIQARTCMPRSFRRPLIVIVKTDGSVGGAWCVRCLVYRSRGPNGVDFQGGRVDCFCIRGKDREVGEGELTMTPTV